MANSVFLKPTEFYQRQINPLGHYVQQNSFYLAKMMGRPIEQVKQKLINKIKNKELTGLRDPLVTFFERGDNGDKDVSETKLSRYISDVVKYNYVLIPTFTVNLSEQEKPSILVDYVKINKRRRNESKHEALRAEQEGDKLLYAIKNNDQINKKTANNAVSGNLASEGSVLHNPTGHNTLTSIIRTVSSLSNASNEKLIAGNRHYYDPDVALNNIISIASSLDKDKLRVTMAKFNFYYPTVDDVMECVYRSSHLYWSDLRATQRIREFVEKLDEVERAGFVYISDLYHIRKHNDAFVRNLLTRLAAKVTNATVDNPLVLLKTLDEQVVNVAHQICSIEMMGIGKKYDKMPPDNLNTLVATCLNIIQTVEDHRELIDTFFLTTNVPASTAYIPNMIRRSVVLSDTDSTMFSLDEFVEWYFGNTDFTPESRALAISVMFIAAQCVAHSLAIFSANMGVARDKLHALAMKPEYSFPVFVQTSIAKHYFTFIDVREGNVFEKPKLEIKGVHLKNSALPKVITEQLENKMREVLTAIMQNEKISIINELKYVADVERSIKENLLNGKIGYYKLSKIKTPEAYARSAEESPYLYHQLWLDVFQPKYGAIAPPPYSVIKIPTILENATQTKKWLADISDRELAARMTKWLAAKGKTKLPTIYIPVLYAKNYNIPSELIPIINIKKIVLENTSGNRIILESLGYFPKYEWLVSDLGY